MVSIPRTISVPGRICVAGESLDWMTGGTSLVASIPLRTFVTVTPRVDNQEILSIVCLEPFHQSRDIPLKNLSKPIGDQLDYAQLSAHMISKKTGYSAAVILTIQSAIPMNAGVSSSAAVTVAVIAALNAYWNTSLTSEEICDLAFQVEDKHLVTGAGQMDFYACGLGGLLALDCSTVPPKVTHYSIFPNDVRVVLVDTGAPHSTKKFLSSKRQRFLRGDPLIQTYIKEATEHVEHMRKLLTTQKINCIELGTLITACHLLLRDCLDSSTPLLETCVTRCISEGAYGAKLTGSGMGGCMFALAPKKYVAAIKDSLVRLPVRVYDFPMSDDGIRIE